MQMFDLEFAPFTLDDTVKVILGEHRKGLVITPNVDHIQKLHRNPGLRPIYDSALYLLADGQPLVWLSRLLGKRLPERVTGADLLPALCSQAKSRVFLVGGSSQGVAELAAARFRILNPDANIKTYFPPFGFEHDMAENSVLIASINRFQPDILFIGVGCPKQELWAAKHLAELDCGRIVCVGNAIDFAAGLQRRAPKFLQNVGLEWAWRLLMEPTRLWKRYLVHYPIFFWLALREIYRSRFKSDRAS